MKGLSGFGPKARLRGRKTQLVARYTPTKNRQSFNGILSKFTKRSPRSLGEVFRELAIQNREELERGPKPNRYGVRTIYCCYENPTRTAILEQVKSLDLNPYSRLRIGVMGIGRNLLELIFLFSIFPNARVFVFESIPAHARFVLRGLKKLSHEFPFIDLALNYQLAVLITNMDEFSDPEFRHPSGLNESMDLFYTAGNLPSARRNNPEAQFTRITIGLSFWALLREGGYLLWVGGEEVWVPDFASLDIQRVDAIANPERLGTTEKIMVFRKMEA